MVIKSLLKNLMGDEESLMSYFNGEYVSFEDLKRRLFLKERIENNRIPDHHYRLVQEKSFHGIKDISETLRIGIYRLASVHLEFYESRIHVKQHKQNEWQHLITYMPPLIVQASLLSVEKPITSLAIRDIKDYFKNHILPNAKYSALPSPFIPQLEAYVRDQKGFHDLHMHLNGSTETDISWQDYLRFPDKIYAELKKGFDQNPKVKEQMEQESHLLTPEKYNRLLRIAQRLRTIFFDFVWHTNAGKYGSMNITSLLSKVLDVDGKDTFMGSYKNPFQILISNKEEPENAMAVECLMYVLILRYLTLSGNPLIASMFHFYLLILGLTNRLLVQQTHQYGFEQFQKHTLNGLREYSERTYHQRFFQMHGNELRNISFLEGRISPKSNERDFLGVLKKIGDGWKSMQRHIEKQLLEEASGHVSKSKIVLPKLKLIAHFIKREDNKNSIYVRHEELRKDNYNKALVLSLLKRNNSGFNGMDIVGIDAASSEFDAGPEVFAPVFRMLRRSGFDHFTYHAGEDYHHIISGLRTIHEAIFFTGLKSGDRIGHATATGISVDRWAGIMGEKILIRRGEWLDDLIFAHHLIVEENIYSLMRLLPLLTNEIHNLSHEIYGKSYALRTQEEAWHCRALCPILTLANAFVDLTELPVFDKAEVTFISRRHIDQDSLDVLRQYHHHSTREKYNEPIIIDTLGLFDNEAVHLLQLSMLELMHKKEIVIETLPTSNVRIGHYTDYSGYHLWNWLKLEEEGHAIPPIIVGSDDTGIFATNIFNEYANIYCHLTHFSALSHGKTMDIIKRLDNNSRIYRFE